MPVPLENANYTLRVRAYGAPVTGTTDMRLLSSYSEDIGFETVEEMIEAFDAKVNHLTEQTLSARVRRIMVLGIKPVTGKEYEAVIVSGLRIDRTFDDQKVLWEVFLDDGNYGFALETFDGQPVDMSAYGEPDEDGFVWAETTRRGLVARAI